MRHQQRGRLQGWLAAHNEIKNGAGSLKKIKEYDDKPLVIKKPNGVVQLKGNPALKLREHAEEGVRVNHSKYLATKRLLRKKSRARSKSKTITKLRAIRNPKAFLRLRKIKKVSNNK